MPCTSSSQAAAAHDTFGSGAPDGRVVGGATTATSESAQLWHQLVEQPGLGSHS